MTAFNINMVICIVLYGFCLIHITLFAYIYVKHKSKIELSYLIVLINTFLLAALIIMLLLVFRIDNFIFIRVLVNAVLSLYITLPLWGYYLFDVDKKYFKNIPILVTIEAVVDNILIAHDENSAHNLFAILYIIRVVFYILLAAPIFIK
ncbi:MAG: hypothetical protein LBI06_01530, partial [Treponema sp.]|nr:hypothetical protein [Treponema sp.]